MATAIDWDTLQQARDEGTSLREIEAHMNISPYELTHYLRLLEYGNEDLLVFFQKGLLSKAQTFAILRGKPELRPTLIAGALAGWSRAKIDQVRLQSRPKTEVSELFPLPVQRTMGEAREMLAQSIAFRQTLKDIFASLPHPSAGGVAEETIQAVEFKIRILGELTGTCVNDHLSGSLSFFNASELVAWQFFEWLMGHREANEVGPAAEGAEGD